MAITQYYVDPAIAGNSGTGTIGDPFGDLQYALDGVGRNAVDGDQFNIKAGTAEILAASLTLATYGSPTAAAPLILRGYTAAAGDGGMGEIDCGGFTMWASTYDFIIMADLEMHTFGDTDGIYLDDNITLFRCEIHKGASTPNAKALVRLDSNALVVGCYLHDPGTSGMCVRTPGSDSFIAYNYIIQSSAAYAIIIAFASVIGNVILCTSAAGYGIAVNNSGVVIGNVIYHTAAGTLSGIRLTSVTSYMLVLSNIVVGFSGVGGSGIYSNSDVFPVGYNAFYNNSAAYSISGKKFIDLTASDVTLDADPFTSADSGDFSLTAAAKTTLASKGFPTAYLGAHASTVPNLNIGPIQLAATAPVTGNRGRLIIPRR